MSSSPGTVAQTLSEPARNVDLTDLLATILRNDGPGSSELAAVDPDEFCLAAHQHGVLSLVANRLVGRTDLTPALRAALRKRVNRELVTDLLREAELRLLLSVLAEARIEALLFKGAQFAYACYPRPDLRPRLDTDLLIAADDRAGVHDCLTRLDYSFAGHVTGELVTYQAQYVKRRNGVVVHSVDVHWRIANPQLFADVLSFEELSRDAIAVPRLSPVARGLSNVHALLVACIHRVAHHFDWDRLVWLYDIHLMVGAFSADDWRRFLALADQRGILAVCRHSLSRTVQRFGTQLPAEIRSERRAIPRVPPEKTAAYLAPQHRHVQHVIRDLRALPSWAARWRLMREHLFPSARYMRETYAPTSVAPLPLLYAQRIFRGAHRWLGRSG